MSELNKKMSIYYDPEGNYLEIRFGKATASYYEEIREDVFERRDEKTKQVKGYAIFNVNKQRKNQNKFEFNVELPTVTA